MGDYGTGLHAWDIFNNYVLPLVQINRGLTLSLGQNGLLTWDVPLKLASNCHSLIIIYYY